MIKKVKIVSPVEINELAIDKGWYDKERSIPEMLCLIHSEISEALEAYRKNIPEGDKGCLSEELADAVIRIFDMAEGLGINIVKAVEMKHEFNLTRPYRHGNKKC